MLLVLFLEDGKFTYIHETDLDVVKSILEYTLLYFGTSNPHKIKEVQATLKDYPLQIKPYTIKKVEIQAETVEEIAKNSLFLSSLNNNVPILMEDTGLFIISLKGFPGPYTAYVHKTIGVRGIL